MLFPCSKYRDNALNLNDALEKILQFILLLGALEVDKKCNNLVDITALPNYVG